MKRSQRIGLFLLIFTALAAPCARAANEPQFIRSTLDQAQQLVDLGQADQALGVLDQLGSTADNYYRVHLVRTQALILSGRYDTAYDEALRAGVLEPGDPQVLHFQAVSLFYLNRSREALPLLNRAIEMAPNFAAAYEYRGLIYRDLGDAGRAEADFQRAKTLQSSPGTAAAAPPPGRSVQNLPSLNTIASPAGGAVALSRSTGPTRVQGAGPAVIGDDTTGTAQPMREPPGTEKQPAPRGPAPADQAYMQEVASLYSAGNYAQAADLTEKQLEQDPENPLLNFNLAALLQASGRLDDALAQYKRAAETDPDNADVLVAWGEALEQNGDTEAGIDKYIEAVDVNPMSGPAHMNLGNAYIDLGEYDLAAEAFENAVSLDHGYMIFYYGLITAYVGMDEMPKAAAVLEDHFGAKTIDVASLPKTDYVDYSLVSLITADPSANYNFARMLADYGYVDDAATFFHQFVQTWGGRFPEAEANARAFLSKHPAPREE